MNSGTHDQQDGTDAENRRVSAHLRVVFETACEITAPFFESGKGWGGKSLSLYARQALREKYPDLTQQDLAFLFSGVQRFHRERGGK